MDWSSEENIKIAYRLLRIKGFGPAQTNRLLWSVRSSVESTMQLVNILEQRLAPKDKTEFEQGFELYQKDGMVQYLSAMDENAYPMGLIELLRQNTPTVLSYMGNLELLKKKRVAFSGSRKCSEKGLWITEDCAQQLSQNDVCIVSGYANGVDMMAHRTALINGASTIVVLPEGISNFYVRKELQEVWDWNRVLVVSEFIPTDRWMASRAMKRNMTILGLSDAVIVVEAGETGGSLDAGVKSIECGKPLFVPQYAVFPASAKGNENLINKGARKLQMKANTRRPNIDEVFCSVKEKTTHQTLFG